MEYRLLIFFTFFSFLTFAQDKPAQEEDSTRSSFHPSFTIGVISGVEAGTSRMAFHTGKSFELRGEFKKSKRIRYGVAVGGEIFKDQTFIPFGLTFRGLTRKKDNAPFLSVQAGYALCANAKTFSYINYSYKGGIFFSPGFGYLLELTKKLNLAISLDYKHQFASIKYINGEQSFTENLDYNFLSFRTSLIF